jgi:hypothetical protein
MVETILVIAVLMVFVHLETSRVTGAIGEAKNEICYAVYDAIEKQTATMTEEDGL